MKKTYASILSAAICASLLASCAPDGNDILTPADTAAGSTAPAITVSGSTTAAPIVTEAESSTAPIVTDAEGGQVSETAAVPDILAISPDFSELNISTEGYAHGFCDINGYICCTAGIPDGENSYERLFFIDTEDETVNTVNIPVGYSVSDVVVDDDDFLCHAFIYKSEFINDKAEVTYSAADITWGFEAEIKDNVGMEDYTYDYGGNRICTWDASIYDLTDGSKKVIVEGDPMQDDRDFDCKYMSFYKAIDHDRFLYNIGGYESIPGFGVYDFSTDKCGVIENSKDKGVFGVYGNEIYSYGTTWDSLGGTTIYVSDADTLETKEYMTVIPDGKGSYLSEFFMSADGSFIVADISNRYSGDTVKNRHIDIIDRETATVIKSYEIADAESNQLQCILFIDDTRLLCSAGEKYYILDIA